MRITATRYQQEVKGMALQMVLLPAASVATAMRITATRYQQEVKGMALQLSLKACHHSARNTQASLN